MASSVEYVSDRKILMKLKEYCSEWMTLTSNSESDMMQVAYTVAFSISERLRELEESRHEPQV